MKVKNESLRIRGEKRRGEVERKEEIGIEEGGKEGRESRPNGMSVSVIYSCTTIHNRIMLVIEKEHINDVEWFML